ncbi:MAG: tetratricopeptide repeat protein [Pseudomonadota bacterium]|nr:tetratricopeptide repeat protein [Pseudomonadota bacterium]
MQRPSLSLALAVACALSACSLWRGGGTPDNEPTLKTLAKRQVDVQKETGVVALNEGKAIEAYRKFLDIAPQAPQRSEAMRRIGDLEMDNADNKSADSKATDAPDYKAAVVRYQDYLKTYPADPNNDRVYYQMARAYEQGGDLETALKTLDRLVKDYPKTRYGNEAQFRRGELLFTIKNYGEAEKAYQSVLSATESSPYQDRSLYMMGWSVYKQGRLEDGLRSFFAVLDLKVAGRAGDGPLDTIPGLSRADRELVEDTFRVASISLANLQGAASIPAFINTPARKTYEFRIYEQLGELYVKQERPKDAADTFAAFARLNPLDAQSPVMQARVIEIYERTGFVNQGIEARKEYVARYGRQSEFRRASPDGWEKAQPLVKTRLSELARHYHSIAQKSKSSADFQEAVRWYRELLTSFASDAGAAQSNFLLAELLFEDGRFGESATEYEKSAYSYAKYEKSADAGYAALLSYAQLLKKATPAEQAGLQRLSIASARRFAQNFPTDARNGPVLSDAAEKLYALKDPEAAGVAQRVIDLKPPAAPAQRRVAWTVLAYSAFDSSAFELAEKAFGEAIKVTPEKDAGRADLVERQAAAIYKQGEQARASGKGREAAASFARVGSVGASSTVRAAAQYDAAATLISLKDWDGAIRTLEEFRKSFPNHPLQGEVGKKLAVAYLEKGNWAGAAGEFERLAASSKDPKVTRDALWQAAEYYEKAGSRAPAAKAYERYLAQNPQPLEAAVESRFRLARIAKADGNLSRETALTREIFLADQSGGAGRTPRTRYLGASAALTMAEPVAESYRQVALVEPLARQLKLKKTKMEETLKAYSVAADYGVADVTTAATYRIAMVYRDFGKALMASERPQKLSKAELEQYNVLLEEQAFPFEEKATELHELNAHRASDGVYDKWVKSSFDALRELRPVRYGKTELSEGVVDAVR